MLLCWNHRSWGSD